jgi:hypothetical protein
MMVADIQIDLHNYLCNNSADSEVAADFAIVDVHINSQSANSTAVVVMDSAWDYNTHSLPTATTMMRIDSNWRNFD